MIWTEEAIQKQLPKDPIKAAIYLCSYIKNLPENDVNWIDEMIETFAFLSVWMDKYGLGLGLEELSPDLSALNRSGTVEAILKYIDTIKSCFDTLSTKNTLNIAIQTYKTQLGVGFSYQLTEGDIKRIQDLITKLRQQIASSQVLGDDHKRRLLMRLEKLQSELHKRMSDYDKVYGLLIDGVILVQKFGEAVKPITELLREIGKLFWLSQIRGEELPGDFPLPLPPAPKQQEDR